MTLLVELLLTTTKVACGLWNFLCIVKIVSLVRCIAYIPKAYRLNGAGCNLPSKADHTIRYSRYIGSVLRPYFPSYRATTATPAIYHIGICRKEWWNFPAVEQVPPCFSFYINVSNGETRFTLFHRSAFVRCLCPRLSEAQNILYTFTFPFLSALRHWEDGTLWSCALEFGIGFSKADTQLTAVTGSKRPSATSSLGVCSSSPGRDNFWYNPWRFQ